MCLFQSAGVAVKEEAVGSIRRRKTHLHHGVRYRIRNELSAFHVFLGPFAQFRALRHIDAEDLSGGDGGNVQALGDTRGLSTLTSSGRAEENDSGHRKNPS